MLEALAEIFAEVGESLRVGGETRGDGDVIVCVLRDDVLQADGGKERDADAGHVGLSFEGDDRDVHVEGFARGCGAVVGKCIEREIHVVVVAEMIGCRSLAAAEDEAIGSNPVPQETILDTGGRSRILKNIGLEK